MKLDLIGVSRRHGVSQSTNRQYDMCRLHVMGSQTPSQNEHNTFQCAGFRQIEVDLEQNALNVFLGLEYPCTVDVDTDSIPTDRGLVTVVTGLAK